MHTVIAKHIPMKSLNKSSYGDLVEYLLDEQAKHERVGAVLVSNCHADTPDAAILEVINTQRQNKRATSDKTYHLVVSFRVGEQPDDEVLKAIETRLCAGLGYAAHQRISVVHHDTDHLHFHIAINKIHPTRYTIHNPHNDHKLLGPLCEKLELEYGLEPDNHQVKKRGAENRADDMERHAGVESLLGWIKRECLDQMRAAQSWSDMHDVMQANGLSLHSRANGLVISAADGTRVKASSIGREFSMAKLVARLGPLQEAAKPDGTPPKPKKTYQRSPMLSKANTVELYAQYKQEQQAAIARRANEWAIARDRQKRLIEVAKRKGRLKRGAVKLLNDTRVTKRLLFAMTSATLRGEINDINKQYIKDRQAVSARFQRRTWADWLRARAKSGDSEALSALRARSPSVRTAGDMLGGKKIAIRNAAHVPADSITKQGTIIYCVGATVVRDRGDKLNVSRGANDQLGLQQALRLAIDRFGRSVSVQGTAEFKEQIARAAAAARLEVTFDELALENRRRELLHPVTPAREKKPEELGGPLSAAQKYVFEREQELADLFDIPKFARYDGFEGQANFAGIRKVDGQKLAFLESGGKVQVLPIDEATARRLQRVVPGTPVTVTSQGLIRTKGRSR